MFKKKRSFIELEDSEYSAFKLGSKLNQLKEQKVLPKNELIIVKNTTLLKFTIQ